MHSIFWSLLCSIPFMILGFLFPSQVLGLMGADCGLRALGQGYVRIILTAAPLFMCNYTFTGFCRNDHAPMTAMLGSIAGSVFNIIFDYVFMFTLGLGFSGAALATACCPVVTMSICATHLFGRKGQVPFRLGRPSLHHLGKAASLGISAFVGEISNGITSLVFNYLMLGLGGNIAVAAYSVVANIAVGYLWTDPLIGIFNSEQSAELLRLAHTGLRLYFLGFLVSGINISLISYFSAIDQGRVVVIGSLLRGLILNTILAFLLSQLFGMDGVWISYLTAEAVTAAVILGLGKTTAARKGS